ncbi:MAG: hypothetical protein VX466_01190 [Myxococcota bacterium]|nr:hypothetical protein [Myxococcota bacterium]
MSARAEKYVRTDAPVDTRRMAARGALPLEPVELATVLFALTHDPDTEVKTLASESLEHLPESVAASVLDGPTHPAVLSHLAHVHRENETQCEKIALNASTDDATLAFLATLPLRRVLDIISNNQERLLQGDDIVEAIGANPLTGRAVIERILVFLGTDDEDELTDSGEISNQDAEAAVLALLGDDMADVAACLASEANLDDEEISNNLFSALQKMSVIQKIKLARLGGMEARTLLVRDRNKVVSAAVISSPRLTDVEVTAIAKSRNVSEEILRMIARNREWTKNYQVKSSLVTNPKCPQSEAIKLLNYLQDKELRTIMKSKDVPSAISSHARRILTKKGRV